MKFQEVMVYKNLFYRSIFALILFIVYYLTLNNSIFLCILATVIYFLIIYECIIFFKHYFYLIISYIFISLFCFYIYFFYYYDFYLFNILVFVIITFDSFSYFTGLLFGKKFIFSKISPKKTLEGYVGGVIFTNIALFCFLIFIQDKHSIKFLIILINSIIIFSLLGDLVQSYFKRKNNLKDSSHFLPGHGGFFDRFDSFLPSIIFLLIYSI